MTVLLAAVPGPRDVLAPADNAAITPLAELRPMEVRIRKLFLVRPDLLRYPIPYDVIC